MWAATPPFGEGTMKLSTTIALSLLCLALAPLGARADEQADQQACRGDAMSICGQFIPDREKVGACLFSNRSRISPDCRVAIQAFHPKTAPARSKMPKVHFPEKVAPAAAPSSAAVAFLGIRRAAP